MDPAVASLGQGLMAHGAKMGSWDVGRVGGALWYWAKMVRSNSALKDIKKFLALIVSLYRVWVYMGL